MSLIFFSYCFDTQQKQLTRFVSAPISKLQPSIAGQSQHQERKRASRTALTLRNGEQWTQASQCTSSFHHSCIVRNLLVRLCCDTYPISIDVIKTITHGQSQSPTPHNSKFWQTDNTSRYSMYIEGHHLMYDITSPTLNLINARIKVLKWD